MRQEATPGGSSTRCCMLTMDHAAISESPEAQQEAHSAAAFPSTFFTLATTVCFPSRSSRRWPSLPLLAAQPCPGCTCNTRRAALSPAAPVTPVQVGCELRADDAPLSVVLQHLVHNGVVHHLGAYVDGRVYERACALAREGWCADVLQHLVHDGAVHHLGVCQRAGVNQGACALAGNYFKPVGTFRAYPQTPSAVQASARRMGSTTHTAT